MSRTPGIFILISLVVPFIFPISHADERFNVYPKENQMTARTIEEVIREHGRDLMSIPGVAGVGQGLCEGKSCIKVFVTKKTPELDRKIPKTLEGYQVIVEETGPIRALPK